jgi:hypothetical protein
MAGLSPSSTRYLRIFLATAAIVVGGAGLFTWLVDPLWLSAYDSGLAQRYCVRDERQNKTNKLAFGREQYDAVMIASSRGTSFDLSVIEPRLFNFSLGGIFPQEYGPYLDFFAAQKGTPRTIYLALDFYGSHVPTKETLLDRPPEFYTQRTAEADYRVRATLSWRTFFYALDTLTSCREEGGAYGVYSKDGRMHVPPLESRAAFDQRLKANLNFYGNFRYGASYVYNENFKSYLSRMRREYSSSRFVVFTTPESAPMFRLIDERGRFGPYARWLKEIVEVFGEVYDFMGVTAYTSDLSQYYDGHHVYPEYGQALVRRLQGQDLGPDFGVRVTIDNVDQHLTRQRASLHPGAPGPGVSRATH